MNNEDRSIQSRFEVIKGMEDFVGKNIDTLLKPIEESWQPADLLPDMSAENWREQLNEFRKRAEALPDELLVVLIGDMVTEEALPTYQTFLNRLNGIKDETGASNSPWAQWSRGWTSEENRHGDLLNKYLFLTGKVDMHAVETTIHHLIRNGFDTKTGNDPYLGFIYTSFQERATKISHTNVAKLAKKAGDERLQKICGIIAGDEARHEKAYRLFMQKIFETDPVEAVLSFAKMMKIKITMPAHLMYDGKDKKIFTHFSNIAQRIEVYTAKDYAEIISNLVKGWEIENLKGLSDMAAKAQDYLCNLSERYLKVANRFSFAGPAAKFSWIFDREV
ncbi:MAG TPA: acyl-ACP desaturase [Ignavibacteriaceae bacterium]|nr:acyl-ACP desaturase [Ignavibacteriaceae bacterium]